MKPSALYAAFSIALCGLGSPAQAADNTLGVIGPFMYTGLSWEHRPAAPGAACGVQAAFSPSGSPPASLRNLVLWGTYDWPLYGGSRLGLLLGSSYASDEDVGITPISQHMMLVYGLSLITESGPYFLRFMPSWIYHPSRPELQTLHDSYLRSGLPWAEFGCHLTPWLDLSIRYAYVPVRLAWRF